MSSSKQILTKTGNGVITEDANSVIVAPHAVAWGASNSGKVTRSLWSYLEIPFMHKGLILACVLVSLALAWIAILVWPRTYESEARLMMRVGRESVSLDPIATTSQTMMLNKTREEEIVSALEIFNSRKIAESVVDGLGAEAILNGELQKEASEGELGGPSSRIDGFVDFAGSFARKGINAVNGVLLSAGIKDNIGARELAVRNLQSSLDIYSPLRSTIICVKAHSDSPEMAQAIASEVTDCFMDEHIRGSYNEGSFQFFQERFAEVEAKLNDLVSERANFMREHQVVSIEANRELLREQLAGIDRDLAVATGELEQALAEVSDLAEKISATDDEIVASKMQASDETWSGMRQQFYELELEGQLLDATLTEDHPRLKRAKAQLEGAREILRDIDKERIDESTTPNPVKTGLLEELQRKETQIVGLRSMIQERSMRRKELDKQVHQLLEDERQLTKIDRDIELTRGNLAVMREKLDEAQVIDELHSDRLSNVHVFQPATFVERAVAPNKRLMLLGFLFVGLSSGLGLAFLKQVGSPTLRTAEDVEINLACPVIAEIPLLAPRQMNRRQFQRVYRSKSREIIAEVLLSQRKSSAIKGRTVGVLGVDAGAGASTVALNLASEASTGCRQHTILVDADSKKRSISKLCGLKGRPGLIDLVGGIASHDDCLQRLDGIPVEVVAFAGGAGSELPAAEAESIVQALEAYRVDVDLMILDLPAASQPDSAVGLARYLDNVILVVESEKTSIADAQRLLNHLSKSQTEVVGVVLTKTRDYLPRFVRRFVSA